MKEQTILIEKLDTGFLITSAGKQHGARGVHDSVMTIFGCLEDGFREVKANPLATSIEITITHKVHYKSAPVDSDNTGNHGV